eukprot:3795712-Amphidinium_carterae.1
MSLLILSASHHNEDDWRICKNTASMASKQQLERSSVPDSIATLQKVYRKVFFDVSVVPCNGFCQLTFNSLWLAEDYRTRCCVEHKQNATQQFHH